MSPLAFERIWGMITNHHAFYNNNTSPQFDPRLQFLIVLYRFGAYGNGASQANVASVLKNFHGIIRKFTKQVIAAIIETLEQRVIEWPTAASKEAIKTLLQRSMVSKMPLE
jgi:hypothetical protein